MRERSKSNAIHIGSIVMTAFLVAMIGIQIWYLRQLERSSGALGRLTMRNYVGAVARDIDDFYRRMSEQELNIPPDLIVNKNYDGIAAHFRKGQVEGVKLLFTIDFSNPREPTVMFYNPQHNFSRENPPFRKMDAVMQACSPWLLVHNRGAAVTAHAVFSEEDRENPIILKPVVNADSLMAGIAGMILDPFFFGEHLLPRLLKQDLQTFFPLEGQDNVLVSIYDGNGHQIFATRPGQGQGEEMIRRWYFAFPEWYLKIQNRHLTPEQWARRQYLLGVCITVLMAGVLLGGIFFMTQSAFRAVKLSRMRTDFVSNVSHELRTPLSSIKVLAEFLRLGRIKDPEQVRQYGGYIEAESQRLTKLIDTILNFSKIESGATTYEFQSTDIQQIVSEAINTVEPELRHSGFTVTQEAPPRPISLVMADKDAICEVLINLLDNAAKYSVSRKDISVRVAEENGFVNISIEDCGIGLTPDDQEKIFEKFYRVSNGMVHNVHGNGLGLTITKSIVESHHGRITVKSEPGHGSTFTVHLPVMRG